MAAGLSTLSVRSACSSGSGGGGGTERSSSDAGALSTAQQLAAARNANLSSLKAPMSQRNREWIERAQELTQSLSSTAATPASGSQLPREVTPGGSAERAVSGKSELLARPSAEQAERGLADRLARTPAATIWAARNLWWMKQLLQVVMLNMCGQIAVYVLTLYHWVRGRPQRTRSGAHSAARSQPHALRRLRPPPRPDVPRVPVLFADRCARPGGQLAPIRALSAVFHAFRSTAVDDAHLRALRGLRGVPSPIHTAPFPPARARLPPSPSQLLPRLSFQTTHRPVRASHPAGSTHGRCGHRCHVRRSSTTSSPTRTSSASTSTTSRSSSRAAAVPREVAAWPAR